MLFLIDVLFLETKMCFCFQCLVFGNGKVFLFPVTPFRNGNLVSVSNSRETILSQSHAH